MAKRDQLADAVLEREAELRAGERGELDGLYQQIARYVLPRKSTFTEEVSPGVERSRYILDSTGPRSLELFASFLHTLLNNPATQWFRLRVANDPTLNDNVSVKQWLEATERRILDVLSGEDANLYSHLHEVYLDLGAFGTAVMFVEVVDERLRVRAFQLSDCVIDEDAAGFIDSVYRKQKFRPRQARQRFGDKPLGPAIDDAKKEEPVEFLHAVFPANERAIADKLPARVRGTNAPYASVWINAKDRKTVSVGTFEEFPYMVPRWYKLRGSVYGRSPSMTALPDIRMTNRMMETILRGAEKIVDPPLYIKDGGLMSPVRLFPGGITFGEGDMEPKPLIPPGASRIDVGDSLLKDRQQAIRDAFFVSLFLTPDSPVKTATQVLQEVDERNRAVSPMLMRTQAELFHRLLMRVYNVMLRSGLLPPAPREMAGRSVTVEYVSPLSSSQRQMEALGTLRLIESLLPWGQIDPGVFDGFEPDEAAKVIHGGSGAPASILRPKSKIEAVRKARAEQQQQQAALQQLIPAVEAGAKVQTAQAAMTRAQNG